MSNMVVRTNIFALNAHRNMKNVGLEQGRASNRLSSGYRINSAADDAAGLAISETMRAQIRGLDQASRNAQDGQAMLLTTEGGLEEIGNMLQRTRELLVQASNDTNTQDQRTMIEQEIFQLAQEIGSMQQRVEFNTNRVLAMGPSLPQAISENVADIEADAARVTDAFNMLDANRDAVVAAREMLSQLDGTITFRELNSRQQAMVTDALALIDLTTVTGGTAVDAATTNIPGNITAPDFDAAGGTAGRSAAAADLTRQLTAGTASHTAGHSIAVAANSTAVGNASIAAAQGNSIALAAATAAQNSNSAAWTAAVTAATSLSTELVAVRSAISLAPASGFISATNMIGMLNTRSTELAIRESSLNITRAQMLSAAETEFSEMQVFANAHTSGDFVSFFQVGANANQGITFDFETVSRTVSTASAVVALASTLVANPGTGGGIGRGIEVSPIIGQIQASLDDVNSIRANLGAVQNRMDFTMRSLDISSENLSDSESRVRNADVAREMMRFTMSNVLQQAAVSMLSQANQLPQNLLQLLR